MARKKVMVGGYLNSTNMPAHNIFRAGSDATVTPDGKLVVDYEACPGVWAVEDPGKMHDALDRLSSTLRRHVNVLLPKYSMPVVNIAAAHEGQPVGALIVDEDGMCHFPVGVSFDLTLTFCGGIRNGDANLVWSIDSALPSWLSVDDPASGNNTYTVSEVQVDGTGSYTYELHLSGVAPQSVSPDLPGETVERFSFEVSGTDGSLTVRKTVVIQVEAIV